MSYLFRRNGIYYFRLVIPPDKRSQFGGKREIRKSLCTYNKQIALITAGQMLHMTKSKIYDHSGIQRAIKTMEELRHEIDVKLKVVTHVMPDGSKLIVDTGDDNKDIEGMKRLLDPTYQPEKTTNAEEKTIRLSEAITRFCEEKKFDTDWSEKTAEESSLDSYHKKIPRYRGMSVDQILATKPKKVLKKYTVNKHLGRANMLFDWCLRHHLVDVNYFKGLNI